MLEWAGWEPGQTAFLGEVLHGNGFYYVILPLIFQDPWLEFL